MRFLIGSLLVAIGILLVIFSRKVFDNFGRIRWAEEKLGGAGTLSFIRIIGVVLTLLGFFIWVGLFDIIFGGLVRTIFPGFGDIDL